MDMTTGRPNNIEDYLCSQRAGQWFGFENLNGDDANKTYVNLIIHDGSEKPTEQECSDGLAQLQAEYDSNEYARKRRDRYNEELPTGDQFDAILKGFNQLRFDGQNLPADLDEVIGIWLGIKSAIPKD